MPSAWSLPPHIAPPIDHVPSAMRELTIPVPHISLCSIGGHHLRSVPFDDIQSASVAGTEAASRGMGALPILARIFPTHHATPDRRRSSGAAAAQSASRYPTPKWLRGGESPGYPMMLACQAA